MSPKKSKTECEYGTEGMLFLKKEKIQTNSCPLICMTILLKIEEIENPLKIVFIWTSISKFKELVKFNSIAIIIEKEICGYPQFPHVPSAHHCRCCHRLFFIFLERCLCLFSWCFDIFIRIATIIRLSLSMSIILLQQRGNEKATTKFWPSQQNSPRNWQKG